MEKVEAINTIEELKRYQTETNKIEAKKALDGFPKKCYDTISSFSNKYGGIIIFGVNEENKFSIDGVYDLNDLQKKVHLFAVILWNQQLDLIYYHSIMKEKNYWL